MYEAITPADFVLLQNQRQYSPVKQLGPPTTLHGVYQRSESKLSKPSKRQTSAIVLIGRCPQLILLARHLSLSL